MKMPKITEQQYDAIFKRQAGISPEFTPGVIQVLPPAKCDLCGKEDELRPYGANGENICFDFGMKNEATTRKIMMKKLWGEDA